MNLASPMAPWRYKMHMHRQGSVGSAAKGSLVSCCCGNVLGERGTIGVVAAG